MSSSSSSHSYPPRDRPAQPSPSASFARLHRHALESILAFSSLEELHQAMQVSHEWAAAVRSMASIGATLFTAASAQSCLLSPSLVRHLGAILLGPVRMPTEFLAQAAHRAANLSFLQCWMDDSMEFEPGLLPQNLRCLHLSIGRITGAHINMLFRSLHSLLKLESFDFTTVGPFEANVDFTLCHAPALTSLTLRGEFTLVSDQQIDQMRSPCMASLDQFVVDRLSDAQLLYLLREPHTLRWSQISYGFRQFPRSREQSEALAGLGATLKTLIVWPARDVSFLQRMEQLTHLELSTGAAALTPESFACPMLTALTLELPFTSTRMRQLLGRLPLLRRLVLSRMSHLQSLDFFVQCPTLRDTLADLSINKLAHPMHIMELDQLLMLRSLTSLQLRSVFQQDLGSSPIAAEFTTPSATFPLLRTFAFH